MAKLEGVIGFTGSIGNLSAYKRKDLDKIIVRKKGGPSRSKIKKSPKFELTRRINSELGGRSAAVKYIRQALSIQKLLADFNFSGHLNKRLKPLQEMDTNNEYGQRNVLISAQPQWLDNFQLNNRTGFDEMIKSILPFELSRELLTATLSLPALLPGINWHPADYHPYFCIRAVLGIVPDLYYTPYGYMPVTAFRNNAISTTSIVETDWQPCLKGLDATTLELHLDSRPASAEYSLLLSIGICFGSINAANSIEQVKYAGAAKILAVR